MWKVLGILALIAFLVGVGVIVWAGQERMPDLDATRTFDLKWDRDQSAERPFFEVTDAQVDELPEPAARAWRALPVEGNVTFVLTRAEYAAYDATLERWALESGKEHRTWRFLYHGAYYRQSAISH